MGRNQENVPGMDENNQAECKQAKPCRDIPKPVQLVHKTDPPAHTRPMELIICPARLEDITPALPDQSA